MKTKEAWFQIERILARRISKATTALEAVAELEIDTGELLEQIELEREALRVMREHFARPSSEGGANTMTQGAENE